MLMQDHSMHLLLVEDNEDHAELITRTLEKSGAPLTIHHASDGQEAMDYLMQCGKYSNPEDSPRPAMIILDLRLPRLDGLSVLKRIKESTNLRLIPTVILSSSDSTNDINCAYTNYANSYLVKPMDGLRFTNLINQVYEYWLTINARQIV